VQRGLTQAEAGQRAEAPDIWGDEEDDEGDD